MDNQQITILLGLQMIFNLILVVMVIIVAYGRTHTHR